MTQKPSPTSRAPGELARAIEQAYGLLWQLSIDKRTFEGSSIAKARRILLEQLDRDGQARGIGWAKSETFGEDAPAGKP